MARLCVCHQLFDLGNCIVVKRNYLWLFALLAFVGLTVDLWSKYAVFGWLYNGGIASPAPPVESWTELNRWTGDGKQYLPGGRRDVIPGWFGLIAEYKEREDVPMDGFTGLRAVSAPLMPRVNQGALFGMGGEYQGTANKVYAVVSFLASVGIVLWAVYRGKRADAWTIVALGLILGGTLGNCYDRVVFNGVRDFLYFYIIDWPVFNIADCCLVCGAIMLILHAVFIKPPAPATAEKPTVIEAPSTIVPTAR
jgi:signal peptidase II